MIDSTVSRDLLALARLALWLLALGLGVLLGGLVLDQIKSQITS